MRSEVDSLVEALRQISDGSLVVLTGAGISAASGLPVFRGQPDAVWEQDVMEMATGAMYRHDPAAWWKWFIHRFSGVRDAKPNEAHRAIVDLDRLHRERGGDFTLITQNFDTLHEDAGSEDVIKVHGTIDRLRCSRAGCRNGSPYGSVPVEVFRSLEWIERPHLDSLPCCDHCGDYLRAHVLLFDEYYTEHADYRFAEAIDAFYRMDLLLIVGSSLAVGITELALETAWSRQTPVYRIDRADDGLRFAKLLRGAAEEVLPGIVETLRNEKG